MSAINPMEVYEASGITDNSQGKYYIKGPSMTGYYGHKYEDVRHKFSHGFKTNEEAEKIAYFMNIAYMEGMIEQQRVMRLTLGLK